jgi:transposase
MRVMGLDVHRSFAVVAILEDSVLSSGGRVELARGAVVAFGRKLRPKDEVVIEATGNTAMIVRLLRPFVQRVVIANPLQVRAIAHAKVNTDKIDAAVLAKLHASGFLPEVWMPDEATETLRRLVAPRSQIVQQMTRIKNRIHGVLHTNLIPPYDGELFSASGRLWLGSSSLRKNRLAAFAPLAGSVRGCRANARPGRPPARDNAARPECGRTPHRGTTCHPVPPLQRVGKQPAEA